MAKKDRKRAQENGEVKPTTESAKPQKKKKAYVVREAHPDVVTPSVIAAAIMLVLGLLDRYQLLPRIVTVGIGGPLAIIYLLTTYLYYIKSYLYPEAFKKVIAAAVVLGFIACGGLFWLGTWQVPVVKNFTLHKDGPPERLELNSGYYAINVEGTFTEQEKVEKKKTVHRISGDYTLNVQEPGGAGDKDFTGTFYYEKTRRKMSKKGRGYHTVQARSKLHEYHASKGLHTFRLASEEKTLDGTLKVTVYQSYWWLAIPLLIFGLIAVIAANFVDYVVRTSRINSLFGVAVGVAVGFTFYFFMLSKPSTRFPTMAFNLFIGGLIGAAVSLAMYFLLKKWYQRVATQKRIHL